ncbi:hypothetical protein F0562_003902 [Nyssa sinensis]|uniref:Dof zinc finger protein n=1 Tax=Nyssa sinensis TaxID=561372 RepID=A0A5J5BX41_9ASTE|nr:hypothetical protein F0562_003902 [Nyssa sinensis]
MRILSVIIATLSQPPTPLFFYTHKSLLNNTQTHSTESTNKDLQRREGKKKMIQELLGGDGLIGGERKFSIAGVLEATTSPSPSPSSSSPSPSTSSSPSSTTTPTSSSTSESQNLRCPRCDSSNTKFCYYNNYNLTQPRHFCKTCRRYWTKGGALRNVPIGGGCRKNKNATVATSVGIKSSAGRLKTASSEFGKSGLVSGFDQELQSNSFLWSSPQNSHLLALLRSTQLNPNPNTISNSVSVKEEPGVIVGTHLSSESAAATGVLNARTLGLDPLSQVSFWRNNQQQAQQHQQNHHHHQQQNVFILGEVQNTVSDQVEIDGAWWWWCGG